MPVSDSEQQVIEYRLWTLPVTTVHSYALPSGMVHHFALRPRHLELTIYSEASVDVDRRDPFAGLQFVEDDSGFYASRREQYCEYLLPTQLVQLHEETDRIAAVARRQVGPGTASFLVALTRVLHRALTYSPGATSVSSTSMHVLERGSGVCQDFTHLMLAVCRRQGIPARYVSGYLFMGDLPESLEQTAAQRASTQPIRGADAMHAWAECLMPDGSWKGFDPTNNLLVNSNYIKVHTGRDYGDVSPLSGVYHGPASHTMDVQVKVDRI